MKLKKVTALLLATSMVLSSVSVAPVLASDEVIFEEVGSGQESASDEVSFGDDFVVEEQNEEDGAADETFFADEVIEDDQVNDDVIAEDTADDQEAYAFEEPIVDENADIYAAIAGEDATLAETVIDGSKVPNVTKDYDGKPADIDTSKVATAEDTIYWIPDPMIEAEAQALEDDDDWTTTKPVENLTKVTANADQNYFAIKVVGADGNAKGIYYFQVTVKAKELTATLKDKSFVWRYYDAPDADLAKDVATTDFTLDTSAIVSGENVALKMGGDVEWGAIKVEDTSGNEVDLKAADVGSYLVSDSAMQTAFITTAQLELDGADKANYKLKLVAGTMTVNPLEIEPVWTAAEAERPATGSEQTVTTPTKFKAIRGGVRAERDTWENAAGALDTMTFTIDGDKGTDAGTYQASIKKAVIDDVDVTKNLTIKNATFDWTLTAQNVRVRIDQGALDGYHFYYGTPAEDILSKVKLKDLSFDLQETKGTWPGDYTTPITSLKDVSGTPEFKINYKQYDNVVRDSGGTVVYGYTIEYVGGLTAASYTFSAAPSDKVEKNLKIEPVPVVVTAKDFTVGVDAEPEDLTDGYTLEDGKADPADTSAIKGGASALARDIKDNRIKATVATTAYDKKPVAIGKYPITITLENTKTSDNAVGNFDFWTMNAGEQYRDPFDADDKDTNGVNGAETTAVSVNNIDKYEVVWGDFSLTFDDEEVAYDGGKHSIKMTPAVADLPEGLKVYFKDVKWVNGSVVEPPYFTAKDATNWKKEAVTELPTETEAGKYTTYMYVESDDLKVTKWTKANLTILSGADAVIKQIDEATTKDAEGNLDPDKIAAARKAYDALTDDEKSQIPVSEVRKLEDAEAAVKDQVDKAAAKEVEDAIDKLPAATDAKASDKAAADKAVEDYNKLTEDQKKLVPEDKVKKMNDVKAAADAAAEGDAKKAAKAVEDEIAALPDPEKATAADKAAADKAKADYDALSDEAKALVPADAVDKMNAVKAAADEAAEKEKEAEKEVAALDEKVAAVKAAKNGADGKKAAEDAKAAYDALSPEAKALMTDEEKAAYEASQEAYKKDKTFESGEGVFRVLSNGEVTFTKPLHPENTWFVVPNQVKKNGFMYKVVKVSTKAFMGCEKATKIKIGKNVQSIGGYAFKNTPAMGKLIMLTSKLASGKVKNSFVGAGKEKGAKLTNEVPSGKSSAYESLFKGEGGMNAGAKFTEAN